MSFAACSPIAAELPYIVTRLRRITRLRWPRTSGEFEFPPPIAMHVFAGSSPRSNRLFSTTVPSVAPLRWSAS